MQKGFKVEYRKGADNWAVLSDTYDSFERAATIATALENRGYQTRIVKKD